MKILQTSHFNSKDDTYLVLVNSYSVEPLLAKGVLSFVFCHLLDERGCEASLVAARTDFKMIGPVYLIISIGT